MSDVKVWSAVTITDKVMQDRPCPDYFVAEGDYDALRDEVARLRGAVESFHNSIPAYSKKKLHGLQGEYWSPAGMMIDTELIANLYAALQPERGSHD